MKIWCQDKLLIVQEWFGIILTLHTIKGTKFKEPSWASESPQQGRVMLKKPCETCISYRGNQAWSCPAERMSVFRSHCGVPKPRSPELKSDYICVGD